MIKMKRPRRARNPDGAQYPTGRYRTSFNNIAVLTALNSGVINMIAIQADGRPLGGHPSGPVGGAAGGVAGGVEAGLEGGLVATLGVPSPPSGRAADGPLPDRSWAPGKACAYEVPHHAPGRRPDGHRHRDTARHRRGHGGRQAP